MNKSFAARTPEQARLLLDDQNHELLGALVTAPHSASELTKHTKMTLKQVHHRLTRLLHAGLIEIVEERQRGGRPVKVYRAAAERFSVPLELTDAATLEELMQKMLSPFMAGFISSILKFFVAQQPNEVIICTDERGQLSANISPVKYTSPEQVYGAFGTFNSVQITPATQQELEKRLRELQKWIYQRATQECGEPEAAACYLGLLFTPQREP